ncbi:MAG: hypothetical protein R2731_18725 [Nocardioides sp.]
MLNSELYSAAFSGHPYVAVVCDNAGFAVIHRLQTGQGAEGFNNMLADSGARRRRQRPGRLRGARPVVRVCRRRGACRRWAGGAGWAAYAEARRLAVESRRPAVLSCRVHYSTWTEAGAWWETGVPKYLSGRAAYDAAKAEQLRWL